ncbi:unnamed protein product, partial [Mesorhabditis spiculigera]
MRFFLVLLALVAVVLCGGGYGGSSYGVGGGPGFGPGGPGGFPGGPGGFQGGPGQFDQFGGAGGPQFGGNNYRSRPYRY